MEKRSPEHIETSDASILAYRCILIRLFSKRLIVLTVLINLIITECISKKEVNHINLQVH